MAAAKKPPPFFLTTLRLYCPKVYAELEALRKEHIGRTTVKPRLSDSESYGSHRIEVTYNPGIEQPQIPGAPKCPKCRKPIVVTGGEAP